MTAATELVSNKTDALLPCALVTIDLDQTIELTLWTRIMLGSVATLRLPLSPILSLRPLRIEAGFVSDRLPLELELELRGRFDNVGVL
jgi:hypothetical protein